MRVSDEWFAYYPVLKALQASSETTLPFSYLLKYKLTGQEIQVTHSLAHLTFGRLNFMSSAVAAVELLQTSSSSSECSPTICICWMHAAAFSAKECALCIASCLLDSGPFRAWGEDCVLSGGVICAASMPMISATQDC